MRRFSWLSIVVTLAVGCATGQTSRPASATGDVSGTHASDESQPDRVSTLVKKQEEQQQRITELEARLALLETEARQQRGTSGLPRTDTIRIGSRSAERESVASHESEPEREADVLPPREPSGKRERIPTLRLYGLPPSAAGDAGPELAGEMPPLQVAPLPEDRARALSAGAGVPGEPKEDYRSALRLLREQRYDDALAAFDRFITSNPDHALVGNALYWRGEAHYAKRDYSLAREAFETLLARFAGSDKAADSLLKVGLCLRRMGDEAQAKSYFRRVQEKFPKSEAAQIASREGAT